MPHYYFHLASPDDFSRDEIGSDFPDIESAYLGACQAALDMSVEMLRQRRDPSRQRFEISNDEGASLFDLPFSEVLQPNAHSEPPDKLIRSLQRHHDRAQQTRFELRDEFEQTRSLLRSTRALLAQSLV